MAHRSFPTTSRRFTACCALAFAAAAAVFAAAASCETAWSSSDPLAMPFEDRNRQRARSNIAPNPSFELKGRGENPEGWALVGKGVGWLDRESGAAQDEVLHGSRAIRVYRNSAGELDEAEGVLSDYIPVIPGNYDFTYDVRLKNVDSPRRRLGGRLGDAVTVRVFFFDADKNRLDASVLNPVSGSLIDTSDKSYSFSNYWSIDEFPWATVRARSYNYPFSEGDLPDRTSFVRLFVGLKGSGTLWLDNVVFRYSKWNFSALERLKPYINRTLSPIESLIPAPKEIRFVRQVEYVDGYSAKRAAPLIVLPDDPAPADRAAAGLLEMKLNAALSRVEPAGRAAEFKARIVESGSSGCERPSARLIFSIGRNRLTHQLKPDLPPAPVRGKEQGYVIAPVEDGPCHVVFLMGETAIGNFYAAATAAQLIDESRPLYHSAAVIDYPDFLGRSFLLKRWGTRAELDRDLEGLEGMSRYKLNKVYAGYDGRTNLWYKPDAWVRSGVVEIGQWCRQAGLMSLAFMVNPYSHFEFEPAESDLSREARYAWTHSDLKSLETLQGIFKLGLDAGAETVMLLADDFVPHEGRNRKNFSLYTPEDRARFLNLQNAQAYVVKWLKAWIDRNYHGVRFEFCPPWYANEFIDRSAGKAEIYLQELCAQIPPEIAIVWTGPTVRSLSIDMADLRRYRDLIGRWPMIWDNTLYARNIETTVYGGYTAHYPGKVRMCNLFEPLDVNRPSGFHEISAGRHVYVNGSAESETYRIKYATVADYEWNSEAYDPELSLWKALTGAYGPACAREIVFFNEAYYGLYDICMRMERQDSLRDESVRRGSVWLLRLEESLSKLMGQLPADHALLRELAANRDRQKSRYEGLVRASSGFPP